MDGGIPDASNGDGPDTATDGGSDGWAWETIPQERIVFIANLHDPIGTPGEIYLLEKSGTIRQLLDDTEINENVSISPDGLEIAFHRWMDTGRESTEIFTRNVDTGQETRVTDNAFADVAPKWSREGTRLVFASSSIDGTAAGNTHIVVVDSEGTPSQVTADDGREDVDPAWCGTDRIVFKSAALPADDSKEEIYVIDVDGTGLRRLSEQSGWESDHDPRCTEDGSRVFFYRYAAIRPWKDILQPGTAATAWNDFYPVNVWSTSTSGSPGDEVALTDCTHSCPYPIPAANGLVGHLHQDFIIDTNGDLVGTSTYFMAMQPDGTGVTKLLPDSAYAEHIPTLQYWDW